METKFTDDSLNDCLYFVADLMILNIFLKIIIFSKEYFYYQNHYPVENRFRHVFHFTFSYNWISLNIVSLMSLVLGYLYMHDEDFLLNLVKNKYKAIIGVLLYDYVKISQCKLDSAKFIRSGSGLDYATGMASNYFHGYLHLLLPDHGDPLKGLAERMDDYESNEQVAFAIKKLFILVPHSLCTKPKISSKILDKVKPLETVIKGRAGVDRPFKNDVYKFKKPINGQFYYIALEGATPLLSFFEAMTNTLTGTKEMEEMHREILFQFYRSIKKFCKESPGTRNEIEFFYYNDIVNGREVDVGKVLRRRIKKMLEITDDDNSDSDNFLC